MKVCHGGAGSAALQRGPRAPWERCSELQERRKPWRSCKWEAESPGASPSPRTCPKSSVCPPQPDCKSHHPQGQGRAGICTAVRNSEVFYLRTTNFVDESPLNPHLITEILSDIISLPVKVLQQLLIRIGNKNPNSPPRLRPLVIWPMPCLLILPVPPQANLTPTSVPLHC